MPYITVNDISAPLSSVPVFSSRESDEPWDFGHVGINLYHADRQKSAVVNSLGLSKYEMSVLDTFPPGLIKIISDEMDDPEFISYLRWRLKQPNAAKKIEADIVEDIYDELFSEFYEYPPEEFDVPGLGKSLSKRFKKLRSKVTRAVKKTPVLGKVYKAQKRIHRKVKKALRPYAGIIIGVAGAALAPLTGGLSLAAAGVIAGGMKAYDMKKQAAIAKKQAKADAAALKAEAERQENEAEKELDKFFEQSKSYWAEYDITPEKWAKLTFEQKLELVRAAYEGRLPRTENAAILASGPEQAAAETAGPTPPEPGCHVATGLTREELQEWRNAGWRIVESEGAIWACPPHEKAPPPTSGTVPAAHAAPTGNYDVFIEGHKVTTVGSAEAAAEVVEQMAQRGDRVEIDYNGQKTGIKIMTSEGLVNVPPEAEQAVKNATKEQVEEIVKEAEVEVEAEKKGGLPGWLIIPFAGAAALIAAKS